MATLSCCKEPWQTAEHCCSLLDKTEQAYYILYVCVRGSVGVCEELWVNVGERALLSKPGNAEPSRAEWSGGEADRCGRKEEVRHWSHLINSWNNGGSFVFCLMRLSFSVASSWPCREVGREEEGLGSAQTQTDWPSHMSLSKQEMCVF